MLLYKLDGFITIIYFNCNSDGAWVWDGEIYHPSKDAWLPLGESYSAQDKALADAISQVRLLLRERVVMEVIGSAINQLEQTGIPLWEILSGLAELVFLRDISSEACAHLEQASDAARTGS